MKILLIEPFFGGSHQQWAEGFQSSSSHQVEILSLPARHWKWRMHGAAVYLAARFDEGMEQYDLVVTSDMLDLATFLGLTNCAANSRVAVYFHENQLTYPWSENDEDRQKDWDNHYAFINYTSAMAADAVYFNSHYHKRSFLDELPGFLKQFPDHQGLENVDLIREKSSVLHLGMDLRSLAVHQLPDPPNRAVILWNHRWEYDKNPEEFFEALFQIQDRGWEFKLVVLGEEFKNSPAIFSEAKERLKKEILHWGFCNSREDYLKWLNIADILPVTSNQDFFGGSVVEAMYCNVIPLLPKRLAYPEHIPGSLHNSFFYDDGDLVNRLQRWIKDVSILRKQSCRQFVEQYDWSEMAPKYDAEFERLIK